MSSDGKNSESPTIERVFGLLDKWRHLPAYKLEPRADIFFALYLPEVLGKYLEIEINPMIVPEFPIKKALLPTYNGGNDSIKADYLALQKSGNGKPPGRAFLVELKTDMASLNDKQDRDLGYAVCVGLKALVKGVIDICGSYTKQKPKYVHLLKLLSELGLIEYEDALFPVKQGYSKALKKVKDKVEEEKNWPSLELVYIQPKLTDTIDFNEVAKTIAKRPKDSASRKPRRIDFKEFAEIIEDRAKEKGESDGIRYTFANYLRKWAAQDAGSPNPKDLSSC